MSVLPYEDKKKERRGKTEAIELLKGQINP